MSEQMSMPTMMGLHNVRIAVSDLDRSAAWYCETFGLAHEDDFIEDGIRTGTVLLHPNGKARVILYHAPERAAAFAGFDPVAFEIGGLEELKVWSKHLTELGVEHKLYEGTLGSVIKGITDPDGIMTRLYTAEKQ